MNFEWSRAKARTNLRKHGIDFADAVGVLDDDAAVTIRDAFPDEERWITLGMDSSGRVVVVVYAWRAQTVRLISARPATRRERQRYEEVRR